MDSIEETKRKCIDFLLKIREMTGGDTTMHVEIDTVGKALGYDQVITSNIIQHLIMDRFIEKGLGTQVKITQMGIMKIKGKTLGGAENDDTGDSGE